MRIEIYNSDIVAVIWFYACLCGYYTAKYYIDSLPEDE